MRGRATIPLASLGAVLWVAACAAEDLQTVAETCTEIVDPAGQPTLQAAIDAAGPGEVVCATAGNHGERVVVTTSGSKGAPLRVVALDEARVAGFELRTNHVVLEGFTIEDPKPAGERPGITLAGTGLQVIGNRVLAPAGAGIACEIKAPGCPNAVIRGNRVRGADGTGILVRGERILIEGNDVAHSRMVDANDADGVRFFGHEIQIRGNYIHDISDAGFPDGEEPHTDCFQTFDHSKPPTTDVLIEDNVCDNVDHQCLIAEAPTQRRSGGIVFRRNLCRNNGSQGVLVRDIEGVVIEENVFMSSIAYFGVVLRAGATGARVAGNTFAGVQHPWQVDESARPGFVAIGNRIFAQDADAGDPSYLQ